MKNFARSLVLVAFVAASSARADVVEPGGNAEGAQFALTNPDEYAWQLFLYMNRQAKPGVAGVADDSKPFGNLEVGKSAVWETWALASGENASEVFKPGGVKPDDWTALKRQSRALLLDRNREREAVMKDSKMFKKFAPEFFPLDPLEQEVRQNRAHFEFIVSKGMYSRDGLEELREEAIKTNNRTLIQFPAAAKEIKAQWLPISEADKPRYFWREGKDSTGNVKAFGLVALHIITKDLPNWFWADFGHIDCETKKGACKDPGQEAAETNPVDATTRGPGAPHGSNGQRQETVGTVWQNYILRGTQIDFAKPFGSSTVLSNPVIENGFQQSSCISCHARASVGQRRKNPDGSPAQGLNMLSPGDPTLGTPDPGLFGAAPGQDEITYLQTDFIWSAPFRAQRKKQ